MICWLEEHVGVAKAPETPPRKSVNTHTQFSHVLLGKASSIVRGDRFLTLISEQISDSWPCSQLIQEQRSKWKVNMNDSVGLQIVDPPF